jgi:GT2 family glycosyltransferase
MARLRRREGDTLTVVDNSPEPTGGPAGRDGARVLRAAEVHTSYYARNRGAAAGDAEWILFLDADVEPAPDLIDGYFDPPPKTGVGVLAGGVLDEPAAPESRPSLAERFAALRRPMDQANTMRPGPWTYAQTANCAVRREAFEAVDGFTEAARSGGDADLCFRVRDAGWRLEPRERASVMHRNRTTLRSLLRQRARHGAGAAWLNQAYPGAFPPNRSPGVVWWSAQEAARTLRAIAGRDRDAAVLHGVRVAWFWAFELGRLFPNHS